jgi:hypothetical protein
MGNRAVITTAPYLDTNVGIYVHWNGGLNSITGFVRAAQRLNYRDPTEDDYGMARLTQIIGVFFGGTNSVGLNVNAELDTDNGDNGTWLLNPGWEIIHRSGAPARPLSEAEEETANAIADLICKRVEAMEAIN